VLLTSWLAATSGFQAAFKQRLSNKKGTESTADWAPGSGANSGMPGACRFVEVLRCGCLFIGFDQTKKGPRMLDAEARN
jgi:hypothetical protein